MNAIDFFYKWLDTIKYNGKKESFKIVNDYNANTKIWTTRVIEEADGHDVFYGTGTTVDSAILNLLMEVNNDPSIIKDWGYTCDIKMLNTYLEE